MVVPLAVGYYFYRTFFKGGIGGAGKGNHLIIVINVPFQANQAAVLEAVYLVA